jgi:tagatose 1,6-diphosphate aldolase
LAFGSVSLRLVRIVPPDADRGFVPYYQFSIHASVPDVGHINLRVGDTDHIRLYAGHIGYAVLEPFRGHRYAFQACRALAPLVRSLYSSVIITADLDNHPSLRTIERLGATFINEVPVPPDEPHYQRGSRSKRRYQWTP